MKTEAWLLDEGSGPLRFDSYEIRPKHEEEVLVEPIYVCWEGNMSHALNRKPVDVCRMRREKNIVIGNAGVVRVLSTGNNFKAGDLCLVFSGDTRHKMRHDYPLKAYGYDAPQSIGLLAKQTVVHRDQLYPIPDSSKLSLKQWAAFSLRYITAWGNWKVAKATFRAMVDEQDDAHPYVWSWGGGASLALLQLAKLQGFTPTMITSQDQRIQQLHEMGLSSVDRRLFPNLDSRTQSKEYRQSEVTFLKMVEERTEGKGVSIFADFIGEPVLKATLKALARPAVLSTAGWKEGMNITTNRAIECMQWHAHIHTHYASQRDARDAMAYAETTSWAPPIDANQAVPSWQDLQDVIENYERGRAGYFPLVQVQKI